MTNLTTNLRTNQMINFTTNISSQYRQNSTSDHVDTYAFFAQITNKCTKSIDFVPKDHNFELGQPI